MRFFVRTSGHAVYAVARCNRGVPRRIDAERPDASIDSQCDAICAD
jgi:hypothetical protein